MSLAVPTRPLTSLELFTGAAGMALGVMEAGFEHKALIEYDRDPYETVMANVRTGSVPGVSRWSVLLQDVRDLDFREYNVDLVAGGSPCVPFSHAGKSRGARDPRNMIPEFVRAVREIAPRAFIFENVKGLVNANFEAYFEYVRLQLRFPEIVKNQAENWKSHAVRLHQYAHRPKRAGLTYDVYWKIMNSADYGIAQSRERVFIVGFRSDESATWSFPEPTHSFDGLLHEQYITGEYWRRHGRRPRRVPERYQSRLERVRRSPPATQAWVTVRDAISDLPVPRFTVEPSYVTGHSLYPGARIYAGHTGSDWDLPSKTIKAGVHGVAGGENCVSLPNGRVRYYTMREGARLQSFPDEWLFIGGWQLGMRQIGNAVPRLLTRIVCQPIERELRRVTFIAAA